MKTKLSRLQQSYKGKMKEATSYLARAKELHDELEAIYVPAMNFSIVEQMQLRIVEEMKELAAMVSTQ